MAACKWKAAFKMDAPHREFLSGIKAELPILLGVIPFGLIYGVLALDAGISAAASQGMSSIIFAGSAQFIFTQLYAGGAPVLVLIATGAVVNLRHALYSASIAPYMKHLPARWKWLLAYLLTDEAYAVAITHYRTSDDLADQDSIGNKHWFTLGAGLALWTAWQLSTAAGIFLGAQIPASWSLDFAVALTFIALVVPALKHRADVAAAITAGVVSILAFGLPLKLGLLIAALSGILVGIWFEVRR